MFAWFKAEESWGFGEKLSMKGVYVDAWEEMGAGLNQRWWFPISSEIRTALLL
jgi:hypothetical protein